MSHRYCPEFVISIFPFLQINIKLQEKLFSLSDFSSRPWEASLHTKLVEMMEFQLCQFKSLKMMLLKSCTQYASKFGKHSIGTGLEKISFHSNPKKRKCQRMFKLQHNCTYLTHQQNNAQNLPSEASTVCEPRTSRCSSWIQKWQRNQRSNHQHTLAHTKNQRIPKKSSTSELFAMPKPLTV